MRVFHSVSSLASLASTAGAASATGAAFFAGAFFAGAFFAGAFLAAAFSAGASVEVSDDFAFASVDGRHDFEKTTQSAFKTSYVLSSLETMTCVFSKFRNER